MTVSSDTYGPTPERLAKVGEDDVETYAASENIHHRTIRLHDASPIDKLAALGRRSPGKGITGPQFEAACRYREDHDRAYHSPSVTVDLAKDRVDCGGQGDIADAAIAARVRFEHARKALDRDAQHILSDVVLSDTPLHVYADRYRERVSQPRDRMVIVKHELHKALNQLVAHYSPPRRPGIVTAHEPGYRPHIPPSETPS